MIGTVRHLLDEHTVATHLAWCVTWALIGGLVTGEAGQGDLVGVLALMAVITGPAHLFLRIGRRSEGWNRMTRFAWIAPPTAVLIPAIA